MTPDVAVFVPGKPSPQGSKRARPIYKGKGADREFTGKVAQQESAGEKLKTWRGDVRQALSDVNGHPIARFETSPIRVRLQFVVHRPVGTPKTRPTPAAIKKPDIDKLARAVLDAVGSAGVWADDSQVVDLHATKRIAEFGEPTGCYIDITPASAGGTDHSGR